jgi:hypothetical protein
MGDRFPQRAGAAYGGRFGINYAFNAVVASPMIIK